MSVTGLRHVADFFAEKSLRPARSISHVEIDLAGQRHCHRLFCQKQVLSKIEAIEFDNKPSNARQISITAFSPGDLWSNINDRCFVFRFLKTHVVYYYIMHKPGN